MRRLLSVLGVLCAMATIATAQSGPVLQSVAVAPPAAGPSTSMVIHGRLPLDAAAGSRTVTVRVTPPSKATGAARPIVRTLVTDSTGRFAMTFSQTAEMGKYTVQATSPGGRFVADTAFYISEVDDITSDLPEKESELVRHTIALEKLIKELLARLPPSPERARLQEQWSSASEKFADARKAPQRLTQALKEAKVLFALPDKGADDMTLEFDDDITLEFEDDAPKARAAKQRALRQLRAWEANVKRQQVIVQGAIAASRKEGELCEVIEQVSEGLQLASTIFNLAAKPFSILLGFARDNVAAIAANRVGGSSSQQFGATQAVKNLGTLGAEQINGAAAAHGYIVDVAAQVSKNQFDKYCESLSGPITAEMSAEFFNPFLTWWTYQFKLSGRLILRYAKAQSGTARAVRGEFMGSGYGFQVGFKPPFNPEFLARTGTILFHTAVRPAQIPPVMRPEFAGKIVEMQAPRAFFLPVQGDIVNGKVTLALMPPRKDFEGHTSAWGMYLMLSPLTMNIDFEKVELPYKGAHHLILRAVSEGPVRFTLKRTATGESATETFTRTKEQSESRATYKLSLRVCAGGC